ncbi:MAG TPA: thioredoxin-like domain-containing protein, partial [Pyrinomonadaceae bacterium]|nr:thioredoxin-like domain-containing protein [Pyrinomonadaceae bacterium]
DEEGAGVGQRGRVRAPELEGGRGWLNTGAPLSLAALRGKVVLLDFWTYGCINCIHIIPDLKRLEAKYARQLVVVGVHSAKFDNEKETENIRRVVLRYGVEHPVVNDADFKIWNAYAVRAWPTQVLIDPAGYVVEQVAGEGYYDLLDRTIGALVEKFRARGELNEQPLKLALERAKTAALPLAFPGKVLADERTGRLFVADSNHHRIVVARLDGTLAEVVGSGEAGRRDGDFKQASFHQPQGLALDGDLLYVADTGNHSIRLVNLKTRTVSTLAGTGSQARWRETTEDRPALETALSSPWDVYLAGTGARRALYVAMAGPHQIWRYDFARRTVGPFAGSGREARIDGPLDESGFAQPSGLAWDGRALYVADSESNIIRAIDLSEGRVRTLAGGDLFEFGDEDGRGDDVRLQHPLGVVVHEGRVLIADTYNHKIKQLDPATGTVKTLYGTGKPGQADGARPAFYEPGGLSVAAGKLYVADTNNHAVRVVDLKTGQAATLHLRGLRPPEASADAASEAAGEDASAGDKTRLAPQRLRAGVPGALVVEVALPEGHHLNASAPQRYRVTLESGAPHLALGEGTTTSAGATTGAAPELKRTSKDLKLPLRLPLRALAPGRAALRVRLTLYYCREDDTGLCRVKTLDWLAPVEVTADPDAPAEIRAQGRITLE